MKFHEKLSRLASKMPNKAHAAREVGLNPTALSSYIAKSTSIPRADIALKIAKAIKVPLDWLVDETQDWPPPATESKTTPAQMSDRELMLEVARRFRLDEIRFIEMLERAEKEDWDRVWKQIEELPPDQSLPSPLSKTALVPLLVEFIGIQTARFHPSTFAIKNHAVMPGSERPASDFDQKNILLRLTKLQSNESFWKVWHHITVGIPKQELNDWATPRFPDGTQYFQMPQKPAETSPKNTPHKRRR